MSLIDSNVAGERSRDLLLLLRDIIILDDLIDGLIRADRAEAAVAGDHRDARCGRDGVHDLETAERGRPGDPATLLSGGVLVPGQGVVRGLEAADQDGQVGLDMKFNIYYTIRFVKFRTADLISLLQPS